ncbi:MAG: hypothetical protein NWS07_01025, partial [Desulfobacterales bacterium]|nr:hypothetical protein [Desulfobacterales bacterium]
PFVKGATGKDIERVQHSSCDKKGCRSAGFPPFKKKEGQGGFWTGPYFFQSEHIYDKSYKFKSTECPQ